MLSFAGLFEVFTRKIINQYPIYIVFKKIIKFWLPFTLYFLFSNFLLFLIFMTRIKGEMWTAKIFPVTFQRAL